MAPSQYCFNDSSMRHTSCRYFARFMLLTAIAFSIFWGNKINADILVIANPDIPVEQLSVEQLSAIYLAKMKTWPNGRRIIPVNREASSEIRAEFSLMVFKEPPEALADYWAKLKFKGGKPPLIQESDKSALLFVQRIPGAIAYVDKETSLTGVKVLLSLPSSQAQ